MSTKEQFVELEELLYLSLLYLPNYLHPKALQYEDKLCRQINNEV